MKAVGETCLKTAAQLTAAWSGDRNRLAQAAELCWMAGFWFLVDWPERIRERYGEIYRRLVGPWTFECAIAALDEGDARLLAEDLLCFVREALSAAPPTGQED
jgi:hypothetical protein